MKIKRPFASKFFKPTADELFAQHDKVRRRASLRGPDTSQANAGSAKSRL